MAAFPPSFNGVDVRFAHSAPSPVLFTEKSRLADGETLVSPGNIFELGFFSPSNISNVKRYVGIWYISSPKVVVWVANRENPVPDKTGVLSAADGKLKLSDGKGKLYWSTQPGTKRSTPVISMVTEFILTSWSSEDDPSPGNFTFNRGLSSWKRAPFTGDQRVKQKITKPKNNCSVFNFCGNFGTCNVNSWLPCKCLPGFKPKFSEKWNAGDFSAGCIRNSSSSCGNDFVSLKRMKVDDSYSSITVNDEKSCREECLKDCQCQAYSFVGQRDFTISCLIWSDDLKNLQEDQAGGNNLQLRVTRSDIEATTRNCETCGTNFVPYSLSTGQECGDLMYFSFDCNNNTDELSFMAPNGNYSVITVDPDARTFVIQMKAKEADNCSAMNSSASRTLQFKESSPFNVTGNCRGGVGNLTSDSTLEDTVEVEISWKPPLEPICTSPADCNDWPHSTCNETGNGQRRCLCDTAFHWDGSALNCTQVGQMGESSGTRKRLPLILGISLPIGTTTLCAVVLIYVWRKKVVKRPAKQRKASLQRYDTERRVKELMGLSHFEEKDGKGIDVPFFDFESILAATNNFSEENKLGKGGFGPVYMGKFPGGEVVAVKRLSSVSRQGLEEFKNEVVLIAKLQHRNLVRLLGYCIRGEEKILLYEYMPNKKLRLCFIFGESSIQLLDWETRFNIIMGVARGMLYLHQDSRLRIIHRDLKTSNILLDAEMNPKISDFGLARMIQGKQTEANTVRVIGTYGYMAPEYAVDGLFSIKSDVFSFGIVMLEIISGRKNTRFYQVEADGPSLVGYGWRLWEEDKALDLMDERVRSSCNASEFMRCVHVGMLCVQEDPSERPTMGDVMLMLSTQNLSLPVPKHPAYLTRKPFSATDSTSFSNAEINAEITSSIEEGR
ncbi:G-type lectin S-receptor-like serine/threonine-protein kinase [Hibiscus syriacus]|uniref:Receptor-like serine/threonine-protein kinase n=1 Tax=Hibiscus syriacus TaxID=106335 RepID=A0A6A3C955_HIBSY|nr:G-type lectin S-receptor-like serine/threonine-protein kinase [Hibiscus syriacus]